MSAKCRDCGAPIVWAVTASGRRMPVNPAVDGDERANITLTRVDGDLRVQVVQPGSGTHRPHHSTCPNAHKRRTHGERNRA